MGSFGTTIGVHTSGRSSVEPATTVMAVHERGSNNALGRGGGLAGIIQWSKHHCKRGPRVVF